MMNHWDTYKHLYVPIGTAGILGTAYLNRDTIAKFLKKDAPTDNVNAVIAPNVRFNGALIPKRVRISRKMIRRKKLERKRARDLIKNRIITIDGVYDDELGVRDLSRTSYHPPIPEEDPPQRYGYTDSGQFTFRGTNW